MTIPCEGKHSLLVRSEKTPGAAFPGVPNAQLPMTLAHLQLEDFLLFQLHPSLFFPGPLGLVLRLSQLLVPRFQLQPSYPERGERPRVRRPAAEPGPEPAHPAHPALHPLLAP